MDYFVEGLQPLGGLVLVERTLMNGREAEPEMMPALMAVDSVLYDPRNGVEFSAARIHWGKWLDVYGVSGGGFAAEYNLLHLHEGEERE
jgi:hypothetical protein